MGFAFSVPAVHTSRSATSVVRKCAWRAIRAGSSSEAKIGIKSEAELKLQPHTAHNPIARQEAYGQLAEHMLRRPTGKVTEHRGREGQEIRNPTPSQNRHTKTRRLDQQATPSAGRPATDRMPHPGNKRGTLERVPRSRCMSIGLWAIRDSPPPRHRCHRGAEAGSYSLPARGAACT